MKKLVVGVVLLLASVFALGPAADARPRCGRGHSVCPPTTTSSTTTTTTLPATTPPTTSPTTTTGQLAVGNTHIGWIQLNDEVTATEATTTAPLTDVIVLTPWFTDSAVKVKTANSNIKVLAYHNMYVTVNDGYQSNGTSDWNLPFSGGMGYAWTSQNHPEWFSLNGSGQRYQFSDFPGRYVMKVGLKAYQDQFASNMIAECRARGCNGVFLDDALPQIAHNIGQSPDYETDAKTKAATASFLANVGSQLKAAGLAAIPNVAGIALEPGLWNEWDNLGSGMFEEKFMFWSNNPANWQGAAISKYMAEGVPSPAGFNFFNTYGGANVHDNLVNVAHALYLAYNDGKAVFTVSPGPDAYDSPPYISEEMRWNLGAETAPRREIAPYTFLRTFERGAVAVRIDEGGGTVNVSLGGTYYDRNGSAFTSVGLGNKSAKILKINSGTGAP